MIRIQQLKMKPGHTEAALKKKAAGLLRVPENALESLEIVRQSIDARKKPDIFLTYTVDVKIRQEMQVLKRNRDKNISAVSEKRYVFPAEDWKGELEESRRPVIVGTGPAGLFCGYILARHGYRPILLERGEPVEKRTKDVEQFWKTGKLNTESNVQFGEGGAGTFSDGKLNTLVKDKDGRNRAVLQIFVENGAPLEILYESRPHIGTDVLVKVVRNMRKQICSWGGEFHFGTKLEEICLREERLCGIVCQGQKMDCERLVLACGHSARDTFQMLYEKKIPMEAKAFAVGLRVEHPQSWVNLMQYGQERPEKLPPAPYKVTAKTTSGRGVYSFCMCPGGYVVNASSEEGRLAVNGMSYADRGSCNANSAVIVQVTPEDFGEEGPLAGIAFQRRLEERAYQAGQGKIPVECLADFKSGEQTCDLERLVHCTKGQTVYADVRSILPEELNQAFLEGMEHFGKIMPGFDREDTVLSGVESRTSSPVRLFRDEALQSSGARGMFPCGEGAGYAGGITSAAMDGIRVAEAVAADLWHTVRVNNEEGQKGQEYKNE